MTKTLVISLLLAASLLLGACASSSASAVGPAEVAEIEAAAPSGAVEAIELPFRDVVDYCLELGYEVETTIDENNCEDYQTCIFPDGNSCKASEILGGACGAEYSYCQQQGFELEMKDGVLSCLFDDGSYCPEVNYLFGDCEPGQITD